MLLAQTIETAEEDARQIKDSNSKAQEVHRVVAPRDADDERTLLLSPKTHGCHAMKGEGPDLVGRN